MCKNVLGWLTPSLQSACTGTKSVQSIGLLSRSLVQRRLEESSARRDPGYHRIHRATEPFSCHILLIFYSCTRSSYLTDLLSLKLFGAIGAGIMRGAHSHSGCSVGAGIMRGAHSHSGCSVGPERGGAHSGAVSFSQWVLSRSGAGRSSFRGRGSIILTVGTQHDLDSSPLSFDLERSVLVIDPSHLMCCRLWWSDPVRLIQMMMEWLRTAVMLTRLMILGLRRERVLTVAVSGSPHSGWVQPKCSLMSELA